MAMNPRLLRPLASGFSPRQIAGLDLWLDAADASTLTIDSGVSAWADKSGGGYNATQSTGINQPALISSGLNGQPVVRFDGTNHYMTNGAGWVAIASKPVTFFVVGKTGSALSFAYIVVLGSSGVGTTFSVTGERGLRFGDGNRIWNTAPLTTAGVATFRSTSSQYDSFQAWANGTLLSPSSTSNGANNYNLPNVYSLGGSKFGSQLSAGDIGELLVYTRSLSDAERAKVEGYLLKKWGL